MLSLMGFVNCSSYYDCSNHLFGSTSKIWLIQTLSSILHLKKKRSALLCRKWSPNKLSLTPNIKLFVYGCVCIPLYISRLLLLQLLYPLFQRCLHFVFSLIVHYDYYYIDRCFTRRAIAVMLASFKHCCSPVDDVTNGKSQFSSNLV